MDLYRKIKLIRKLRSGRIALLLVWLAHMLNRRYYSVRIDPVFACNLRCRMCYFSATRKPAGRSFTRQELDVLARRLFRNALQVAVGCGAEPTLSNSYLYLVRLARSHGVPTVSLVTNGQLIDYPMLYDLLKAGLSELIISIHGVSRTNYEYFMVGASWDKLHSLLADFGRIRKTDAKITTALRINYTANPDNIEELERFFEVFGRYGVNTLQVRPVMAIGGEYDRAFDSDSLEEYHRVVRSLSEQCREHGVRFLVNVADPAYTRQPEYDVLVEHTYKYVSPGKVVAPDFDWMNESYRHYLSRTGWGRKMLYRIFFGSLSAEYDGDMVKTYGNRYDIR